MRESQVVESKGLPLYDRFPALASVPRVVLGAYPSAIERIELPHVGELWLKRDDGNAPIAAGNKVRALEFLLGSVRPGDLVLTAGGEGSTHVYATAVHAARLGARTMAVRWRHDMNPEAVAVAALASAQCETIRSYRWPGSALLRLGVWRVGRRVRASWRRSTGAGVCHYVPIGGSTPLGVLGHVNAGLELAAQVAAGVAPEPTYIVVPFGTGGTAAGLAVGLGIGGLGSTVVAARVAPRVVVNAARLHLLLQRTLHFIRRKAGVQAALRPARIIVDHSVYGGAYGRPLAAGARAATLFRTAYDLEDPHATPPVLDATYAAKAAAAALVHAGRHAGSARVMLWVTFDGRVVSRENGAPVLACTGART